MTRKQDPANGRASLEDFPDALIERAILGELPADVLSRIEALPGFEELRARMLTENEAILNNLPPLAFGIEERSISSDADLATRNGSATDANKGILPFRKKIEGLFSKIALSAAPVAALFLIVLFVSRGMDPSLTDEITRSKGSDTAITGTAHVPLLEIWRKTGGSAEELNSGDKVRAYDTLQVAYTSGGKPFGMIVSVDGSGKLSLHFPESFDASVSLVQGATVVLPYAYQLDEAPGFERFLFITGTTNFEARQIWGLLEAQLRRDTAWTERGSPALPSGFETTSFLVRK